MQPVMEERKSNNTNYIATSRPRPPPLPHQHSSLLQPSQKKKQKSGAKALGILRSVFRTFPIMPPMCKFTSLPGRILPEMHRSLSGTRLSGTLFGYPRGRVSLSLQESPMTLPTLVLELAMQTNALQKEMSMGMVRIALECEKRVEKDKIGLLEEPLWTMYCNGKKNGYGVKREANEEDLQVMELLKAASMGAGVLPRNCDVDTSDDEMAYMRSHFEHVVGSKDSETLYLLSPDGYNGPELSIFFVRI